jgi:hypothetical protein
MKRIKFIILICLFSTLPFLSFAWGVLGHRIVGEIATSYLTPNAKAGIQNILGVESLAMASNWADLIRSDSTFRYLSPWHYISFNAGLSGNEVRAYLKQDTAVDIYTKMNFLVKELKRKNLPLATKAMYLKLLVHFVGDAHQPLHNGRADDMGGNRVRVQWFNTPSNLHTVWDESLVNFQQLSYTEYTAAINHTTLKQRQAWQKQPISEWLIESYGLVEKIYPEITEKEQKLSYDYNFRHVQTVNEQLLKGGVRLAGLLNEIFK